MPKLIGRTGDEMRILMSGNRINLCYPNIPVIENKVNLNYFHSGFQKAKKNQTDSGARNLGDDIAPVLVEYMLKSKGLSLHDQSMETKHLYTIGSILFMGHQDATVWGSGILTKPTALREWIHNSWLRRLDIRCVRGPYTRQVLQKVGHDCPAVYGDPGCLLPLMYHPHTEKKLDFVVIPHVSMEKEIRKVLPEEYIVSMATEDYKTVIDKICSAEKVIASSLHGIVFSEAYHIPTIFFQDREERFNFKYADWYEGTGRKRWDTATVLEDAIKMNPMPAPDLSLIQQALIESFPYDLWRM